MTKLLNVELSQEEPTVSHNTYQYNRENRRTLTPLFPDNTTKGKTIIKRQTNSSHILNFDISIPSTSRHIHCQSPEFDGQVPSTSSRTFTPPRDSDLSEEDQRRSSAGNVDSPNKRRRSESTEETFLARLATVQRMNPDVQVHSTPHGPTPPKHMKTSSILKKSILF